MVAEHAKRQPVDVDTAHRERPTSLQETVRPFLLFPTGVYRGMMEVDKSSRMTRKNYRSNNGCYDSHILMWQMRVSKYAVELLVERVTRRGRKRIGTREERHQGKSLRGIVELRW